MLTVRMSPEDKGRDQHGASTTKENQRCPENSQTLGERPGTALRRSQPADSWSQDFQLPEERDNKFLLFYTTRSVVLHYSSPSKWTHTHTTSALLGERQPCWPPFSACNPSSSTAELHTCPSFHLECKPSYLFHLNSNNSPVPRAAEERHSWERPA